MNNNLSNMSLQDKHDKFNKFNEKYKKSKAILKTLKLSKLQTISLSNMISEKEKNNDGYNKKKKFLKKTIANFVIYNSLGIFNLSDDMFDELWSQKPDVRGKVFVYGKEHDMPRFCKSYGKSYTFSKREHKADPIDSIIIDNQPFLQLCVNYLKKTTDKNYNQILINWYPDNQSYIGAHSDDESMFVDNTIICFNYCRVSRDIIIKRKSKSKSTKTELLSMNPYKYRMENNTGYEMTGSDFQDLYTHEVPKRASNSNIDERRISLTFRIFND